MGKNAMTKSEKKNTVGLRQIFGSLVNNANLMRSRLVEQMFDPRRDIAKEAGYPTWIKPEMYRAMYDREGVAQRVVHFWPEESWTLDPEVFETEEPSETPFEKSLDAIIRGKNLYHFLQRLDEVCGIGRYGVMLLGLDDLVEGKTLLEPVEGVDEGTGKATAAAPAERKLLYLRIFSEDVVEVDRRETNAQSPRFGKPVLYTIIFTEFGQNGETLNEHSEKIHWTRIIHVADRKEMSETFGMPRMQPVWNRLLDLQKIMGGSGEMFWKGAFPGYSIETQPDMPDVDLDTTSLRTQLSAYFNGLQRYLALTGVTVKSLTPQVAPPTEHRDAVMDELAFSMGVPKRKLFGSEQAQLASGQDTRTFNGRVKRRNDKFVTPEIVRQTIDRLIDIGVLEQPPIDEATEGWDYTVNWPDLNTVTDEEKAAVGAKRTEALAKYVAAGVEEIIPPEVYLKIILGMDDEEVETIMKAAEEFMLGAEEDEAERLAQEAEAMAAAAAAQPPVVPPPPGVPPVANTGFIKTSKVEGHLHAWLPGEPETTTEDGHNHSVIFNDDGSVELLPGPNGHIHTLVRPRESGSNNRKS